MAKTPPGLWRERLVTDAAATTAVQRSDIVPPGESWFVQRVAVVSDTTALADVTISIETPSYQHTLDELNELEAGTWEGVTLECWLREGERLRADWSGIVSGERVKTHVTGEKWWSQAGEAGG